MVTSDIIKIKRQKIEHYITKTILKDTKEKT
jgi:hypothetical protein